MVHNHLNIKTLRFNGITIFAAVLLILSFSFIFDEKVAFIWKETRFQSFKKNVKTQKRICRILFITLKQVEQEIIYAHKKLGQQMKIFKALYSLEGLLFRIK